MPIPTLYCIYLHRMYVCRYVKLSGKCNIYTWEYIEGSYRYIVTADRHPLFPRRVYPTSAPSE